MLLMDRHRYRLGVTATCIALATALAASVAGQASALERRAPESDLALLGLVRRADGSPLTGATVIGYPAPFGADVVGLEQGLVEATPRTTETDQRGSFRLPMAGPARLEVRHDEGLGAVVGLASPGVPLRIVATPVGEISLPPMARGAFLRLASGESLGWRDGARLRLPAGTYRLLARLGDEFAEHRVTLTSSTKVTLFRPAVPPTRVRVEGDRTCDVVVDDWYEAPLRPDADGRVMVWPTPEPDRGRRLTWRLPGPHGALALHTGLSIGPDTVVQLRSPTWRKVNLGPCPPGKVATLLGNGRRCVALAPIVGESSARAAFVPELPERDEPLHVLIADGAPISVVDVAVGRARIGEPRRLIVRVVDDGGPVADATLELNGPPPHVLRRRSTNARGIAVFDAVPDGGAFLALRAAEHVCEPVAVDAALLAHGAVTLHARVGVELIGRVTLGSEPLPRGLIVDLTLRDPTATLDMPTRRTSVAADGRFRFGGLERTGRYTLFASAQVSGITYSDKVHGVLPGTDVALQLRTEDVPLPGPRRR